MSCDQEFREGQRVTAEYEGTVRSAGVATVTVTDGRGRLHVHNRDDVTFTALDPAGSPPQAGDVWMADGATWLARTQQCTRDKAEAERQKRIGAQA